MKNYIFKNNGDKLEFVGDFDGLYQEQDDPWHQSGQDGDIKSYYENSRQRLNSLLKATQPSSLLEVGCGLGYTTNLIRQTVNCDITGMDISKIAIEKARQLFPDIKFVSGDIISKSIASDRQYNMIVLNQLLWYVLPSLDQVIFNCDRLLTASGKIVISQAFFKSTQTQKYGKDICDGFQGLLDYIIKNVSNKVTIASYNYDDSKNLLYNDGLLVLRKII